MSTDLKAIRERDGECVGTPALDYALASVLHERDKDSVQAILDRRVLLALLDEARESLAFFAAYPLEEFGMETKPDERPLFGANEWQLRIKHVRNARAILSKLEPK